MKLIYFADDPFRSDAVIAALVRYSPEGRSRPVVEIHTVNESVPYIFENLEDARAARDKFVKEWVIVVSEQVTDGALVRG